AVMFSADVIRFRSKDGREKPPFRFSSPLELIARRRLIQPINTNSIMSARRAIVVAFGKISIVFICAAVNQKTMAAAGHLKAQTIRMRVSGQMSLGGTMKEKAVCAGRPFRTKNCMARIIETDACLLGRLCINLIEKVERLHSLKPQCRFLKFTGTILEITSTEMLGG